MSRLVRTKAEFQELAELRLEEARVLLDQGKWDGAYYLAGYAVELALKARIIKEKRYHRIDKKQAEELYAAIDDAAHGVLPWIKTQW